MRLLRCQASINCSEALKASFVPHLYHRIDIKNSDRNFIWKFWHEPLPSFEDRPMKAINFNTCQVWYFTTPGYLRSSLLRTQGKDTTAFKSSADIIALAVNTLRPRQDSRHFPDDIIKLIFLNEDVWILINISLEFVSNGPIDNISALVRVMAWCRLGEKPLSEPGNDGKCTDAYIRHSASMS